LQRKWAANATTAAVHPSMRPSHSAPRVLGMPTHLVGGQSDHHQSYHQIPPASTEPECLRSLIVFPRIIVAAQDAISDRLKVAGQCLNEHAYVIRVAIGNGSAA
jgi:hypothetical protein